MRWRLPCRTVPPAQIGGSQNHDEATEEPQSGERINAGHLQRDEQPRCAAT